MSCRSDNPLAQFHPLAWHHEFWPDEYLCPKQRDTIMAVEESRETYVKAANKMGKDWVAARIVLINFLRAIKCGVTCRIVTTSVAEHHLNVLWGEITRAIETCRVPLLKKKGGPLVVNHMRITRASDTDDGCKDPLNYLVGRVSKEGEGLAGHHAEYTLAVGDEASGLKNKAYEMFQGWASYQLYFGNPNSVPRSHFWRAGLEAGDLLATR